MNKAINLDKMPLLSEAVEVVNTTAVSLCSILGEINSTLNIPPQPEEAEKPINQPHMTRIEVRHDSMKKINLILQGCLREAESILTAVREI